MKSLYARGWCAIFCWIFLLECLVKTNTDLHICLKLCFFQRDRGWNAASCYRLTYLHCCTQVIPLQGGLCVKSRVPLWLLFSVQLLSGSASNYSDLTPCKLCSWFVDHVIRWFFFFCRLKARSTCVRSLQTPEFLIIYQTKTSLTPQRVPYLTPYRPSCSH